jgi:TonB family protein
MRFIVITVLLLAVLAPFSYAQDKTKTEGKYDVRRCAPKLISRDRNHSEFHFRKGETYMHSPVVAFQILESGETANAILKRSSGAAEVDKYALKSVQGAKFNKRSGCGVIESQLDITIDFR